MPSERAEPLKRSALSLDCPTKEDYEFQIRELKATIAGLGMQLTSLTYANRNLEEALDRALEKLKGQY